MIPGSLSLLLAIGFGSPAVKPEASRACVTFVLGEDEQGALPLYDTATSHFRTHPQERTERVVTHLRSIRDVRDYLLQEHPEGAPPWGVVNLVVHGNVLRDLTVPVTPGGPLANAETLAEVTKASDWVPLGDGVLDAQSEVRVHGCGVGARPALLSWLSIALGGRDPQRPLVRASRYHTCFQRVPGKPEATRRFLCHAWDTTYPLHARPTMERLAARFEGCVQDPMGALTRRAARFDGDSFVCEGEAVFSWTLIRPDGDDVRVPVHAAQLRAWLHGQRGFMDCLSKTRLSLPQLKWEAEAVERTFGERSCWGIQVTGRGRVVHLLQALASVNGQPPEAAWDNPAVYVSRR